MGVNQECVCKMVFEELEFTPSFFQGSLDVNSRELDLENSYCHLVAGIYSTKCILNGRRLWEWKGEVTEKKVGSVHLCLLGFPDGSMVKNLPATQEMQFRSLGQEDPLEEEMATHSTILAWRIPWTEEPGGLQSMGSQRVRHN